MPMISSAARAELPRTSALAALRYRDYRLFWLGMLVSNTGTWMQMFGQGYLVVQLAIRDGVPQLAPLYLGLVGLARAVPGLTLGLFGGAVADRADRRRLLMVTQTSAAATAGILASLTIAGRITIVEIVLLGALSSMIFAFDAPTRQAMVPRLVPERDLMSAIGLNSAAFNGPQIFGPVIGGFIFVPFASATTGAGVLFAVNALSYLAVVAALLAMGPIAKAERRGDLSMLESIREGLGYIRREPVLRWVVILSACAALLARPYLQLLPAVAHDRLHVGAVELSWMLGAAGVGSLAGAIATAASGNLRRRGLLLLGSGVGLGLLLVLFTMQRELPGALAVLVIFGFVTMLFMGVVQTLLQTRSPDHLRGRVMSLQTMLFMGIMPLGSMLLGSLGTVVGVDRALLAGGLVVAAVALFAAIRVAPLRNALAEKGTRRRAGARPAGQPG